MLSVAIKDVRNCWPALPPPLFVPFVPDCLWVWLLFGASASILCEIWMRVDFSNTSALSRAPMGISSLVCLSHVSRVSAKLPITGLSPSARAQSQAAMSVGEPRCSRIRSSR